MSHTEITITAALAQDTLSLRRLDNDEVMAVSTAADYSSSLVGFLNTQTTVNENYQVGKMVSAMIMIVIHG